MFLEKFRLDGKVALITGVGPTNGKHIALAMAEAGADVALVARSNKVIGGVAEEIKALGRRAVTINADVTDSKQVDRMAAEAKEKLGHIDILFNHVGGGGKGGPLLKLADEDWHGNFLGNLYSMFYCSRAVGNIMVQQGRGGAIINTSSVASVRTPPGVAAYSIAKAAVNQFTRCLAAELAPNNVRVNCVMLGTFENAAPHLPKVHYDDTINETLMHRFGKKDEVAPAALFLASDAASYVTGVVLRVSGGWAMFG